MRVCLTPSREVRDHLADYAGWSRIPFRRKVRWDAIDRAFGREFTAQGLDPWAAGKGTHIGCTVYDYRRMRFAEADAIEAPWFRLAGFVRAIPQYPRLKKLLHAGGRNSRSGLTYFWGIDPCDAHRMCPSPGRWERWIGRVIARAAVILRAWDTHPSYIALARSLQGMAWRGCQLPRVGKIAIRMAAETLLLRFGQQPDSPTRPVEILMSMRFRGGRGADPLRDLAPDDYGTRGDDDTQSIISPVDVLACDAGLIQRSPGPIGAATVVQVIVTCPTIGVRHHLTVPPWFGLDLRSDESPGGRVRLAVAWTFAMSAAEYRPQIEV